MTKRKVSGQTIAIIVLVILLILTASFGGVYAYYSTKSSRVSGRILLTSLSINFGIEGGNHSGSTEMFLSDKVVVPNEKLGNDGSLVIKNSSSVPVYIAVVYTIHIEKCAWDEEKGKYVSTGEVVMDDFECPFLDFGEKYTRKNGEVMNEESPYVYSVFTQEDKQFHCILTKMPTNAESLTIVGDDELRLHKDLTGGENDKYMSTQISFTMQAFAIGSNTWAYETAEGHETEIMQAIYQDNASDFEALHRISQMLRG